MSIGTIFLIAVAVAVMFLMVRTARGSRGVAERPAADVQADNARDGASLGHSHGDHRHG